MAKYYHSDYALNKKTDSIIYRLADGSLVEITMEDYLSQNPELTEEQFHELKELSDEMFKDEMNADKQEHRTVKKQGNEKNKVILQQSQDDMLIEDEEREKIRSVTNKLLASGKLSKTQERRFKAHYYDGKSYRQIGREESVSQVAIFKSVKNAVAKLKKFYEKG